MVETDVLGRLETVTLEERKDNDTVSEQTKYRYDDVGNLLQVDLPGDIIQEYTYDALNRLVHLRHYHDADGDDTFDEGGVSPDPVLAEFAYTVDTDGQRSRAVETDDQGRTTTIDWVYDELGRLVEERYDPEGTTEDFIARYAFDLASNRVKLSKDEENADRLLFAADEVTEYFYDANDRLTRETFDAATGDTTTFYEYDHTTQIKKTVYDGLHTEPVGSFKSQTTYEYNLQGRLEKIEIDSDGVGGVDERYTYKYNDAGIRVSSTDIAGSTTLYHVDSNNHTGYAQVLEEGVDDGDGRLQSTDIDTTYTLGHDVIAQQSDTEQGGQTLALLPDGHGSTRALITAALTLAEKYAYDAYGNMLPGAGLHTDPATALTSLLYSGEQTDPTGQQYLRARYYDPTVGRFNRLDPFAGNIRDPLSLHKYLYTHGNPVMLVDPSGLFSVIGVSSASSIGAGLNNITATAGEVVLESVDRRGFAAEVIGFEIAALAFGPVLGVIGRLGDDAFEGLKKFKKNFDETADALSSVKRSASSVFRRFDDLAKRRRSLGLPPAGSAKDGATLARLEIDGVVFDGINQGLQTPRTAMNLDGVNPITLQHAEAEAVQHAINGGMKGRARQAELWVDREPCAACGRNGGLRSLARNLGVEELIVYTRSGPPRLIRPT